MDLKQSIIFKQVYKKLHKNQLKTGDLAGVMAHQFKY